jgi:hypothetical protein
MSEHYGQWQAQGDDIKNPPKGHCRTWGQDTAPTKDEGCTWLGGVMEMCSASQRRCRQARAYPSAQRFVRRAPPEGYPTTSVHFYAFRDSGRNERIDLEIWGYAFRNDET